MISLRILLVILVTAALNCKTIPTSSSANEPVIIPRSGWNANEPRTFQKHVPARITVHHEGTFFDKTGDAAKKIRNIQIWGMGPDRNWSDIPYHFLIAPDGKIYEGRDVFTVGETATEYDPTGHLLITCLGNYEVQEVSEETINSLVKMIAYCSKKYDVPVSTLSTHRDNSKQTTCPGKNLYKYFEEGVIKKKAEEIYRRLR